LAPQPGNGVPGDTSADRIAEQAAYFGITPDAAIQIGHEASEFTKQALTKPFTIYTRWRRALGRSAIWRYYAIVVTADGRDLNELLVSEGLARIYGTRTPLPDGRDSRDIPGASESSPTISAKPVRGGAASQQSYLEQALNPNYTPLESKRDVWAQ
jgi:endonuclease YncB( thermonuclease family)